MNLLRSLIGIAVLSLIIGFTLLNRQPAELFWSPFHPSIKAPFCVFGLIMAGIGFIGGGVTVWIDGLRGWGSRFREKRRVKRLEKEMATLRQTTNAANQTQQPQETRIPRLLSLPFKGKR